MIRHLHEAVLGVVDEDTDLDLIGEMTVLEGVARMRSWQPGEMVDRANELMAAVDEEVEHL